MKAEMHRQNLRGRRPVRADHRLCADDEPVRTQSAIFIKTPKASLGLSITVFLVRMRFSSVPKTGLARGARNDRSATLADETGYFELQRQILYKSNPKPNLPADAGKHGATHG
jgi:hypothetical protein